MAVSNVIIRHTACSLCGVTCTCQESMEAARNTHALLLIGQNQGGGTALNALARTSQQLLTRALHNLEESRTEKSSQSSAFLGDLRDKEYDDIADMRNERRRLANAGFQAEAALLDPQIEHVRKQKKKAREEAAETLMEKQVKAIRPRNPNKCL